MSLLLRRLAILAKIESSYGVDPTPSPSADAVIVENFNHSYPAELEDPPASTGSISPTSHVLLRRTAEITFDVPLKGSGAAGTAPEWGPLLRACGFSETIDPGVSVTYEPESTSIASVTIYAYVDGLLMEFNGCRGNVVLSAIAADKARLSFTFRGKPAAPVDAAFPTISNTDTTSALRVESATFTVGGDVLSINGLTVDMQNEVEFADDITQANALGEAVLGARLPVGTINPEAVLVATKDLYGIWSANTQQAIALSLGSVAGNQVAISIPDARFRELTPGDRQGAFIYDIPFTCVGSDDEVSIVLT